jgi:2-keto-4-pentenoate hydratase/2-oxohepta-3-ene-1,7-dioic acid hydratase in catechol pathway
MRIVSFGERGMERAGLLVREGNEVVPVHDLDPALPTSVRALIQGQHLGKLAERLKRSHIRGIARSTVRLGPPLTDAGKIVCIGLNYKGHATEQNKPWPEQPLLFAKAPSALCGAEDDIVLPAEDAQVDYEVELAVVIGRRGRRIAESQAMIYVAGYLVANDVSARRWQKDDGQWFRAKSADTFFPCGPALVTCDEVEDPGLLRLTTTIAGSVLQDAPLSDLIHDIPRLIAYISRDITLEPGDIISTGTPAGVGCYRSPPRFLAAGDLVECAITGACDLGRLRNRVIAAKT